MSSDIPNKFKDFSLPAKPTLHQLLTDMPRRDAEFAVTERIPVERLVVTETGLTFDKNSFALDQSGRNRLLAKAKAPVAYMSERRTNVQMLALREHLSQGAYGKTPQVVTRNGQVFTILPGKLIDLGDSEVLGAATESLGKDADNLVVSKIDRADGRLELELVSPVKALEIRRGDVVQAGLHISHTRFGDQATQIQAFIYRLVCENGMMRRECITSEGLVRTRKLSVTHPNGRELQLDQIRRLTTQTWEKLEPQLAELRSTAERPANVEQLLKSMLRRARVSTRTRRGVDSNAEPTVLDRLLQAWRDWGADDTYFGAVNALTRVGTHDLTLSLRQRRVLSMLGGVLAFSGHHLCPKCFSMLADSGTRGERQAEQALIA